MRVKLYFATGVNPELEKKLKGIEIIRLMALVQFQKPRGWTNPETAIIDTGAPLCLIPLSFWSSINHRKLADHEVSGIVKKPEWRVPVTVEQLTCKRLDAEGHQTKALPIHAFLAPTDDVPLMLGFKDLLARFIHHFDYRKKEAYIEE